MPASPHVLRYASDDHVRQLLDQRNARADTLGRFSAISECSDTPSVYSRTQFSPGPSDSGDHLDESLYPTTPSARARLNDSFDTVGSSMLDLGYDPRTSYMPSDAHEDERLAYDDESEVEVPPSRMSYLGPKMRFHSRAPWEMDGDTLEEEDEFDYTHSSNGFPFSRSNASKTHIAGPSSPRRSQATSRPSGESSRSQIPPKRSFETINSQMSYPRGALYALAQESLSATSLGRIPAAPIKESIRSKFSRSRPPPADISTGSLPNPSILAANARYPPPSPTFETSLQADINFPHSYKNLASSEHAHMHPYANPDLVVSYAQESSPRSSLLSKFAGSRNDSSVTVTGTLSMDSITKSSATLTPDSSVHSFKKQRASSILSKTISSPVQVNPPQGLDSSTSENNLDSSTSSLPPNVNNIAGWTERNAAPAFSLISLEEARAQRVRSVASQQNGSISSASRPSNVSGSAQPAEAEFSQATPESDASPADTLARSRGRSMSAGAKARNVIQTIVPKVDRRDSEPAAAGQPQQTVNGTPGKTLKHKKSGFMRLFNGNKSHEKDDEPPPVPILPDADKYQAQQRATPRPSIQRIPVPSLSPSLYEVATSTPTSLPDSPSRKADFPSPKRTLPALSINTYSNASRSSTSAVGDRDALNNSLRPWASSSLQPQSAPANIPEFPALSLRPVSTLFSAHFGDHLIPESRSSDETTGIETPRSSSPTGGLMSPLSPVSLMRTSNEKLVTAILPSESDEQLTIKSLQKQLASSKVTMQRQIWELEGQVRDLKAELEDVKGKYGDEHCAACGRGRKPVALPAAAGGGGVVNRPRARTGTSSRFAKV